MEVKRQYAYFSAAIRDGAKMVPSTYEQYFAYDVSGKVCAACAVGAGYVALCITDKWSATDAVLIEMFPYLARHPDRCPECHTDYSNIWNYPDYASHLFEHHGWSREKIADWLYAEEEKLGFVTISDETEALKPQVGFINNATEARAGVLTKRF